ncbi:MAG: SDR family NAD(P)-dependent oxidoreductase [Bdellovibrionales bacterium]|nr:SDR family NAD(P)-dependent oxidoreductase [Bdellovibrionales bacterium]
MAKSKNRQKKIAIVTGASAGLGKEFALQIEKEFFLDEIWLIARRMEPMKDLCEKFSKSKGVCLSLDLTNEGDMLALQKRLSDENPDLVILVNNAGYGKIGPFEKLGLSEQLSMIDLNVRSLTELTHIALPHMKSGGAILQVASSIAYCPAPNFAVYAASKAYVLSLAEALGFELKARGVHVMAVCPGPVETEFFSVAQKNEFMKNKVPDADPFNKSLMAHPKDVVERALKDLRAKKSRSVYGLPIKLFVNSMKIMPKQLAMRALARRKAEKA